MESETLGRNGSQQLHQRAQVVGPTDLGAVRHLEDEVPEPEVVVHEFAELLQQHGRALEQECRANFLGKRFVYPTNIPLRRLSTPLSGVYAVRLHGLADQSLPGMANLGTRPTVKGREKLLEVHLFDFNEDIYGRHVSVEFMHKLRDEQRFESLQALKEQIARDEGVVRGLLGV